MFQVSDELLSQLPPQQFAPQQQVSGGGGLQHGGAGREIRLTARYGSHPYQPVISQATSEASSSSLFARKFFKPMWFEVETLKHVF